MLPLRSLNGNTSFIWDLQRKRYSLNGCALLEGGKIRGTWSHWDVLTIPGEKDLSISSAFPDQGCPGQAQMPSVRAEWWPQSCPSSSALSPPQMPVSAQWLCDSVGAMSSPWGPGLPSWTGTPKQSPPSLSSSRINPITGSMMGKWIQRGGFLLVSSWQKFPLEQRKTNYSVFYIRHFYLFPVLWMLCLVTAQWRRTGDSTSSDLDEDRSCWQGPSDRKAPLLGGRCFANNCLHGKASEGLMYVGFFLEMWRRMQLLEQNMSCSLHPLCAASLG